MATPMTSEPPSDAIEAQAYLMQRAGFTARHIVDGGAYRGDMTARYLESFPDAHLWVFEPSPEMVTFLQGRFRHEARVTVVAAAISDSDGRRPFVLNQAPATNSLLPFGATSQQYLDYPVPTVGQVEVDVVTLDGFCRAQGLESLSIVKLDVQGAALEVVTGAPSLLAGGAIDLYFSEFAFVPVYEGQTRPGDLLNGLGQHDYRLFDVYNVRRSSDGQLKWCDALFTSPGLRRRAGI